MRRAHVSARGAMLAVLVLGLIAWLGVKGGDDPPSRDDKLVGVMTRDVYLGADVAPVIRASSLDSLTAAAGKVFREVTANDFPGRFKSLAKEILSKEPDLVGLQGLAQWRSWNPSLAPLFTGPSAGNVAYDYLKLLLAGLNRRKPKYEVVISRREFDFEAPADEYPSAEGSIPTLPQADVNARWIASDAILARRGAGVKTANPQSGDFKALLAVPVLGRSVTIKRGWTAIDAKVRGGPWFRFVNTELEGFDLPGPPGIRAKQAAELVAPGGPATSSLPVVLVGDLNSDDDTVAPGDRQAYETLIAAGMAERSTNTPLGCCLNSSLLAVGKGGSEADFDHQVDHILTRNPSEITLQSSAVTGLQPVNGFWDSDHAGLFSALRFAH